MSCFYEHLHCHNLLSLPPFFIFYLSRTKKKYSEPKKKKKNRRSSTGFVDLPFLRLFYKVVYLHKHIIQTLRLELFPSSQE